jgi:hypothetical protein
MPWFEFSNSDRQFFVDDADAPAVSAFRWRIEEGVPFTRGRRSRPIEHALGLPRLKGPNTRAFRDGNPLNFSRANYSIVHTDRFADNLSNIDRRIGVGHTSHNRYFVPNPRLRRHY